MAGKTLLLVDDNEDNLASLRAGFARFDYEMVTALGGQAALDALDSASPDVVITDLKMPGADGLQVLDKAQQLKAPPAVIILTAFGTIESAVEALQRGAFTYLTKPVNLTELRVQVAKAMDVQDLRRENLALKREVNRRYGFEELVGETREMHELIERMRAIADTRATVLIEGESGTGKELVARALHRNSSRASKPFIPIHCAALSESLMESELFGHEKGAFTGANARRQGMFELAEGGTAFLDEVGEIPLATQVKLLRVLENREFLRVGGTAPVQVDVRVLAATNRSLAEEIEEGRFREDLYYRLNVVRIDIPPLRARTSDIPILIEKFLKEFSREHGKAQPALTKRALNRMLQFPWPGNVRQLRNVVENLVLFARGTNLDIDDLPQEIVSAPSEALEIPIGVPLDQIERQVLEKTLIAAGGNRTRAAELLGISRRTLLRKIKELGLEG